MEKLADKIIREQQLPDCILNNPEFKNIKIILNRDASLESGQRIEGKFVSVENNERITGIPGKFTFCEKIVKHSGSGFLFGEGKSKKQKLEIYGNYLYKVKSRPAYDISSTPGREKADVKYVEFDIDITDKYCLELIKHYNMNIPKSVRFEVLPDPQSFELPRAKNKNLDTSQIVKVTQTDFNDNSFTDHYDRNGLNVKMHSRELFKHIAIPKEPQL